MAGFKYSTRGRTLAGQLSSASWSGRYPSRPWNGCTCPRYGGTSRRTRGPPAAERTCRRCNTRAKAWAKGGGRVWGGCSEGAAATGVRESGEAPKSVGFFPDQVSRCRETKKTRKMPRRERGMEGRRQASHVESCSASALMKAAASFSRPQTLSAKARLSYTLPSATHTHTPPAFTFVLCGKASCLCALSSQQLQLSYSALVDSCVPLSTCQVIHCRHVEAPVHRVARGGGDHSRGRSPGPPMGQRPGVVQDG